MFRQSVTIQIVEEMDSCHEFESHNVCFPLKHQMNT